VLNNACVAGDVVVTQGYTLSSIANALPSTGGTVTGATTFNSSVTINGGSASGYTGFKNRIINGGMVIDQRNNGASITPTNGQYSVDRWGCVLSQASKYTVQQNAGSVTPPAGYKNYLGITSSSAYTVGASEVFYIYQPIEGLNIYDFGWGAAGAATITVSFWVRSSLTGTFGASIVNSGGTRSYPFTYTISAANTWEQKTITIAGDTSGTWLTTNGVGLFLVFSLGVGTTYQGTANSWQTGNYSSATGATSVVGTSGATFYITGVQLERGSNATSFEFRDYGRELIMCQRYYEQINGSGNYTSLVNGFLFTTADFRAIYPFKVRKRAFPTATFSALSTFYCQGSCNTLPTAAALISATLDTAYLSFVVTGGTTAGLGVFMLDSASTSTFIGMSSEL
jgi:hypothetical protein